jgi:hypothetical protein
MDQSGYLSKPVDRWYDWQAAIGAGLAWGGDVAWPCSRGGPVAVRTDISSLVGLAWTTAWPGRAGLVREGALGGAGRPGG